MANFLEINTVAKLMCEAGKSLHHRMFNSTPFINFRVGSGKSTYFKTITKAGKTKYSITFGKDMISSKLAGHSWRSNKEIKQFNFFNGDDNIQNTLIHTVLHEYAHFIHHIMSKNKKDEKFNLLPMSDFSQLKNLSIVDDKTHGRTFHNILKLLYKENMHNFVKDILTTEEVFNKLEKKNKVAEQDTQNKVKGDTIYFLIKNRWIQGTIKKVNPKTYTVQTEIGGYRVPKSLAHTKPLNNQLPPIPPLPTIKNNEGRGVKGQKLTFIHKGQTIEATITKVNTKTYTVTSNIGDWRIPFSLATLLSN